MADSRPSLLLVDDDATYRERLAKALAARGYEVRTAADGKAAEALAEGDSPEFAVLDLRMPGESGLDLLRSLMAIDPTTRVLMLTGYGSIATAMEAVRLGAVNYLTKPADVDDILAAFHPEAQAGEANPNLETPSLARVEWEHIQRVLNDCEGNLSEAARRLGMHRRSLQRKVGRKRPAKLGAACDKLTHANPCPYSHDGGFYRWSHCMRPGLGLGLLCFLLSDAPAAQACGACGCTLHSDWATQGYATQPGFRFDLRYDYFNQDQLRSGTRSVARGRFEIPNEMEIQEKTLNRNLTATVDYSPNADWGVTLLVPVFNRYHATIAEGDPDLSFSRGKGLGDVRVVGRYQGFAEDHSFGVQFGVKLATGDIKQTFHAGTQAGKALDRGLQLGTGTTDLLLGFYAFGNVAMDWGVFGQVLFQKPTGEKDGFKPGDGLNANVGLRYTGHAGFTPHLQLNVRAEGRESGLNADVDNSGATLVYLSPGVTFNVSPAFQVYVFGQVPVAQRVNGLQLEPKWSASLGMHWTF